MLPEKLCAYEAGLGVYGRSGLILHPELGNRTWMLHPVHCELAQSLAPGEGWPDDH
jgi:hypothetical protein